MTIAELLCAGQRLTEKELRYLATGYDYKGMGVELGDVEYIDKLEGNCSRWIRHMDTIFKIRDDLWDIPWEHGLAEYQEDEFNDQPYRVREVRKMVEVINYLPWEEEEDE